MSTNRVTLTQARVRNLPLPSNRQTIVHDALVPGFGVRLSPGGTKSFVLYRKINGRPQIITLGRFPALSVEQARKIGEELNGRIARGENPQDAKRAARTEATLGDLFAEYLEQHAKLQNKTWHATQARYNRHLLIWSTRKLSSITRRDIQRLHSRMGEANGQYAANRVLQLLHSMFNQAISWGMLSGSNPAHGIGKYRETKRERFLNPEELPRFFQALADEPNETIRDFVLLALLTGARRSNVLSMRWDEINTKGETWTIPGDKSKNYEAMTLPLHQEALGILERRRTGLEWVFPSRSKSGHLEEPKTGWKRILKRAGIEDLRIHDLRRTLGSWQAAQGASLTVIGKSLGHRNISTTAIYARLNIDPVRASVDSAVNAMFTAAGLKQQADVVPLKRKS